MNPYDKSLIKVDREIKKTHVLYVDGDAKLCDGCDEMKENVASISMISGGVECLCRDCVKDILKIWEE